MIGYCGDTIGRTTAGEKVISQENAISRNKGIGNTEKRTLLTGRLAVISGRSSLVEKNTP
jgi:hypothetical protein